MAVSVHRLVHRGAARNLVRDRIAIEDALGSGLPDDGRLVLVRKLSLTGAVADPRGRQEAVRRGWLDAVSGAVHATSSFADHANCVWFASRAEAETILLRKLLAGERVFGWFWALAVPDWADAPLVPWLERQVAVCVAEADYPALVRTAQTCVEAGGAAVFVEAANRALGQAAVTGGSAAFAATELGVVDGAIGPLTETARSELVARIAHRLAPRTLPGRWRELVSAIDRAELPGEARRQLAVVLLHEKVRRASPALALRPALLRAVAEALREVALQPAARPARPDAPNEGRVANPARTGTEARPEIVETSREPSARSKPETQQPEASPSPQPPQHPHAPPAFASEQPDYLHSRHAGIWLVVPSLVRLGFREWLTDNIELLGEHPGRTLVHAVAAHHRVSDRDPALAALDLPEDDEIPGWAHTWTGALDRWLRRTARRRIHDLVARRGKLALADERLDIHFPIETADLRLRRLALDRDPGWTDWLGLSVRYHFDGPGG